MSQTAVGWLIVGAALLTFAAGIILRAAVALKRDAPAVAYLVRALRASVIGRILFGRTESDALDDDELDQMIVIPAIVLACGLFLTGVFLLGYTIITEQPG